MLPISNSTSPADTTIEQMAPVIGITTGAEEYENNYRSTDFKSIAVIAFAEKFGHCSTL